MQFYEITHIVDNKEWENKFAELAKRCKDLNGWSEKDLLQFAVASMPMYRIWLIYLEDIVTDLEQSQKRKNWLNNFISKKNKEK